MSDDSGQSTPGATTGPAARPWHGHENPFEALYQHFTAQIAALKQSHPLAALDNPSAQQPTLDAIHEQQRLDAEANERARVASEALRHHEAP